ncbi:N-acetyl-gamma-glutamyl-phosphate reductase [Barrientosiimonas humi]|uniref:N-acetyl-gamma-glutamyl-phosphate reductase n=2 Tax=Barrientosiimonas humi TaxID=999931 RepID=A0A542XC86_9MICO|nr:N-acetyl-gamma-glutamyl-phosphate reductase [Barrientosiimonas humi]CAG7573427.1 N-acetyl-gamma-glutamyl-phosphate reductase [Barrientosiimonas humi]
MRMLTVGVAGASGYAGSEALRLLLGHPDVRVGAVTGASTVGQRLGELAPHLAPLRDRELVETTPQAFADHDVVILALPHGASAQLAAQLPDDVLVLDCGADFRLVEEQRWTSFYDTPHACSWPYGLPELVRADGSKQRDDLVGARRVAIPGCYPTAATLALAPAFAAGVVAPDDVVVVAASGTSGAGRSTKPHLMASAVMGSMSPYGVGGGHRHTPEIEQNLSTALGQPVTVSFTPTLAPMPRGILATCTARLAGDPAAVRAAYERTYADEPFVRLLPEGEWPATGAVLGSNVVQLQVAVDEHAGRVVVVAAEDNLTKGTAGAAVQCLNLALDLPETRGLPTTGLAP